MINWVLIFARDLVLAVWLGGLIVIDFVETPARFRAQAINRNQVVAIARTLIDTPTGTKVPIGHVAEVRTDQGPNTINRENVQRRIIVQANVADRDLGSVIEDVRAAIGQKVQLPQGYFIQYGGQFESQEKASRQIFWLSLVAIAGIFLLLYIALKSVRFALLVMANLPLALIGGVVMVFLSGGTLSVASLVGFITLFGITTRNGIMLISHYTHLMKEEGVGFRNAIVQGSMERLSPVLMTALVTGVGLTRSHWAPETRPKRFRSRWRSSSSAASSLRRSSI